ncbi:MAG TPA: BrnT family toxin [Propylenella sp.]
MALLFTWDAAKAVGNWRKHRITFETAARVFADPFALTDQDRIEDGEYRWQTIGSIEGVVVLVAHTVRGLDDETQTIHIISARRAKRPERQRYEEERARQL